MRVRGIIVFVKSILADLDPWGPYLLADFYPSADNKNITILVESDNNSESRFLEKFFRKYVFKVVGTF